MKNHDLAKKTFFSNDFSNNKTVFLIGSSHVGVLNVTTINNSILSNMSETDTPITVYNLSASSSTPIYELNELDEIILAHPKIIFYGISYRDFAFSNLNDKILPDPEFLISDTLYSIFNDVVPSNPQWLTRTVLKEITNTNSEEKSVEPYVMISKTPFYSYRLNPIIETDEELKKQGSVAHLWQDGKYTHVQTNAIHHYIQQIRNNDIEVVLFSTPLHRYYLDPITEFQKKSFSNLLDDLAKKYDVTIYKFEEKYADLPIWQNTHHVSFHANVTEYNNDVAQMILMETLP